MSSLSAEQVKDLTERINERFAEFDVEGSRVFEWVTPGVVRLVFDVINEWAMGDACQREEARLEADEEAERARIANVTEIHDKAFTEGWKAGRVSMRGELEILGQARPHGKLWVGPHNIDSGIELNVENYWKSLTETHPDAPAIHIDGNDQIRADIRDHTAYPSLEDQPNGADVFAEHPVAGLPEPEPPTMVSRMPVMVSPMKHEPTHVEMFANGHHADELELSTATVVTLGAAHTGGNGHHAELSPATTATLGPEHTVVTPLIPRRPRTSADFDALPASPRRKETEQGSGQTSKEVDGSDDDTIDHLSRPGARAKKELDELRAKAAARERLGEVSREQMIAELRRQAMAGTMPTQDQFDIAKPAVWPKAQMLTKRFDATWTDLAREAGLKLVRR